jgi:hypothetical protein
VRPAAGEKRSDLLTLSHHPRSFGSDDFQHERFSRIVGLNRFPEGRAANPGRAGCESEQPSYDYQCQPGWKGLLFGHNCVIYYFDGWNFFSFLNLR